MKIPNPFPEAHFGSPPEAMEQDKFPFGQLHIGVEFWHEDKQYLKVAVDQARRLDRPDQGLAYVQFEGNEIVEVEQ